MRSHGTQQTRACSHLLVTIDQSECMYSPSDLYIPRLTLTAGPANATHLVHQQPRNKEQYPPMASLAPALYDKRLVFSSPPSFIHSHSHVHYPFPQFCIKSEHTIPILDSVQINLFLISLQSIYTPTGRPPSVAGLVVQ